MAQKPSLNSILNLGIPAVTPDMFKDDPAAQKVAELVISVMQNLQLLLEQYGGYTQKDITEWPFIKLTDTLLAHQLRRFYVNNKNIKCTQALAFGDLVNIWNNAGVSSVQKAFALAGNVKRAFGICSTVGGIAIGGTGEIILLECLVNIAGVFPGDILFLSKAAQGGIVANVPPVAVGDLEQTVGFGIDVGVAYLHMMNGTYIQH